MSVYDKVAALDRLILACVAQPIANVWTRYTGTSNFGLVKVCLIGSALATVVMNVRAMDSAHPVISGLLMCVTLLYLFVVYVCIMVYNDLGRRIEESANLNPLGVWDIGVIARFAALGYLGVYQSGRLLFLIMQTKDKMILLDLFGNLCILASFYFASCSLPPKNFLRPGNLQAT